MNRREGFKYGLAACAAAMAVIGLCHLCPRPAISNCFQCGQPTCVVHLDPAAQLCESCRGGKRIGGGVRRA